MPAGKINRECRTFETSTASLDALLGWLTASGCTHVAMEATGVYWKPVWSDALGKAVAQIDAAVDTAVAASMLTAIYHMLKDGTHHQDLGADHFDRRSNEVKARHHVAQLARLGFHVEIQPAAQAA
jgi:long-subunit fatty acid transport protein